LRLTKSLLVSACLIVQFCSAQDSSRIDKLISFPDKLFAALDKKTVSIEQQLDRQTDKYFNRLQRQERKLKKKLWKKDSALAKQVFGRSEETYNKLKSDADVGWVSNSAYSGHMDSLTTALSLLKQVNIGSSPELQKTLNQYRGLQAKFDESEKIKIVLEQRQRALKAELEKVGMARELKQFRKSVYYYQQQVREYRSALEDPSKFEAKVLEVAMKLPQFKEFFSRNSIVGRLFSLPPNYNTSLALAGLQTRSQVQQQLVQRLGTSPINGVSPQQYIQGQIQQAQSQLAQLKDRLNKMGLQSGNGTTELPDFKPNNQKTKPFLQRLEYGFNIQNQRTTTLLPVTSDLAALLGYKLNDRSTVGIGASYKLGLGKGFQNIHLTHEGVGLRSFVDYKIKGSFWLAGGFEYNYMQAFKSLTSISNLEAWQKSGLIGISKKLSSPGNKQANLQLLYDFFALKQLPRSQPVKFRIGYTFHK
jgi:hypothetical protein